MYDRKINPYYANSSGELVSSQIVNTGVGALVGVNVITNNTNDATCILYDSLGTSGTKLYEHVCDVDKEWGKDFLPTVPIDYTTGLYLSISGTGASAIVYYVDRTP